MLTEAPAPEVTEELSVEDKALMHRYSHVFGNVYMFPPEGVEPSEWGHHAWRITTDKDGGRGDSSNPLDFYVKPDAALTIFNSPGLMHRQYEWDAMGNALSQMTEVDESEATAEPKPPSRFRRKKD